MVDDSLEDKCKELAQCEIGWWKAHHRKDLPKLVGYMTREYKILYGLSDEDSYTCVNLRIDATKEHDIAEKFEDKQNIEEANLHWNKAEELLEKHFELLLEYIGKNSHNDHSGRRAIGHEKLLSYNGGHNRKSYNHS